MADEYVKLAKEAVEEYVKTGKVIKEPKNLPKEFYSRRAGAFVTIRKGKELRGCIGTFLPAKNNLAKEIISNAVAACSRDSRFYPVTKKELPGLSYEVSILSEPRLVKNKRALNPKKNGIIVRCEDGRCGLLLPDLAGIEMVDRQIFIACQKGGIDYLADKFTLYSFTVEKHG